MFNGDPGLPPGCAQKEIDDQFNEGIETMCELCKEYFFKSAEGDSDVCKDCHCEFCERPDDECKCGVNE